MTHLVSNALNCPFLVTNRPTVVGKFFTLTVLVMAAGMCMVGRGCADFKLSMTSLMTGKTRRVESRS
jgi:hypothetical protein